VAIYTNAYLYLGGQLLVENTQADVSLDHQVEDFYSIENGYEASDIGPSIRVIRFDVVVPVNNPDVNYEEQMLKKVTLEMRVEEAGTGGRVCISRGRIVDVRRRAGIGQTYTLSVTFKGSVVHFQ